MLKVPQILHRSFWIGIPLVVLFFVVWSSTYSASYQTCQIERAQNGSDAKQPDFGQKVAYFFVCEGVTLDDNADLLTALATLAVAGFTLTLWLTSNEQARLTRKAIEVARDEFTTTHRPRIRIRFITPHSNKSGTATFRVVAANVGETPANVTETTFEAIEHEGWEGVNITLKPQSTMSEDIWMRNRPGFSSKRHAAAARWNIINYGRTPAIIREVRVAVRRTATDLVADDWAELERTTLEREVLSAGEMLFENSIWTRDPDKSMDDGIATALQAGSLFVYFFGHVDYEDVFGLDHEVQFCWRYSRGHWRRWGGSAHNFRT
ncbi:MAG TPA: hypothetical protein VMD53_11405 [Rhizomicrobium sp.]|nr:hypothetical protein [Rhizomicrobium sp.]